MMEEKNIEIDLNLETILNQSVEKEEKSPLPDLKLDFASSPKRTPVVDRVNNPFADAKVPGNVSPTSSILD